MNSKQIYRALAVAAAVTCAAPALAQEHYTEGAVFTCDSFRVKEGKWDTYMRYLRTMVLPQSNAARQAGLMVDRAYFVKPLGTAGDWNYMSCVAVKNFAALDYNAADEKKMDDIAAAQMKTADRASQDEMTKVRFGMREFVGSNTIREIVLKPLP